jgi:lysophospholipase L1-like esterase
LAAGVRREFAGVKMLLFWCELEYLLVMAVWLAVLGVVLRSLLLWRRRLKATPGDVVGGRKPSGEKGAEQKTPGTVGGAWKLKLAFSVWSLLALLTSLEFVFAAFVDTTDAFNATNVCHRWFRRHVDPYRNEAGFRDRREPQAGSRDDVRQIYFFGDSFTIAQGVDRLEDRFTDLVEAELNLRRGSAGSEIQVANFGEFGWDVSLIEGMVRATLEQGYQPDVIVYVYMLNDIEGYDPRTEVAIKSIQQSRSTFWLWQRTYFFNWLHFCWQQAQAGRTVDYFPHLADSYDSPVWVNVRASLQRIKERCDEHGVEFRMVFFPFLHNLGPEYPFKHAHQKLAEFCDDVGVRYLDLEPVLTPHTDEGLMVNRFDNHPNERCHAIVADAIVEQLLADQAEDAVLPQASRQ